MLRTKVKELKQISLVLDTKFKSGIYFVQLQDGSKRVIKRLVVSKE